MKLTPANAKLLEQFPLTPMELAVIDACKSPNGRDMLPNECLAFIELIEPDMVGNRTLKALHKKLYEGI